MAVPDEATTVFLYSLPSFVERLDQNLNLVIVEAAREGVRQRRPCGARRKRIGGDDGRAARRAMKR